MQGIDIRTLSHLAAYITSSTTCLMSHMIDDIRISLQDKDDFRVEEPSAVAVLYLIYDHCARRNARRRKKQSGPILNSFLMSLHYIFLGDIEKYVCHTDFWKNGNNITGFLTNLQSIVGVLDAVHNCYSIIQSICDANRYLAGCSNSVKKRELLIHDSSSNKSNKGSDGSSKVIELARTNIVSYDDDRGYNATDSDDDRSIDEYRTQH